MNEKVRELIAKWRRLSEHCDDHEKVCGACLLNCADELEDALAEKPAERPAGNQAGESFQQRVRTWTLECFGQAIADDKVERNHRFLEESLELVQALGCTQSEARQLVDYVFSRPSGNPKQECGGVRVTLAALCNANQMDARTLGEAELERVWKKIDVIRAKQAAKPKHSPLSEPMAERPQLSAERLFDLVQETREKLRPYLKIETFPTGSQRMNYLAVDTILQAAFEALLTGEADEPQQPPPNHLENQMRAGGAPAAPPVLQAEREIIICEKCHLSGYVGDKCVRCGHVIGSEVVSGDGKEHR